MTGESIVMLLHIYNILVFSAILIILLTLKSPKVNILRSPNLQSLLKSPQSLDNTTEITKNHWSHQDHWNWQNQHILNHQVYWAESLKSPENHVWKNHINAKSLNCWNYYISNFLELPKWWNPLSYPSYWNHIHRKCWNHIIDSIPM